jgi:parallel beta-helix repeat protein
LSLSTLRKLLGIERRTASRPGVPSRYRLDLEALENRLVPSTLHVGSKPGEFLTVQAAVTAAHSNDTIKVDPGAYTEQVTIDNTGHSRDNLKLEGSGQNSTFIQLPAVLTGNHAVVDVTGTQNVTIDGFTIEGPASAANSGGKLYGIRIDGGGSATITQNHITKIEDTPFGGVQEGIAILVGRAAEGQTGSAIISHNLIDNYEKGGIVVDNAGSSAEIDHNTIIGAGPTAAIAQNGIQISRGATGDVNHNDVSENIYTGVVFFDDEATGILLYQVTGSVRVDHNTLSQNDVGIEVEDSTGPNTEIDHNQATESTHNGIVLDATSGVQLDHNDTSNNGNNAVIPVQDDNGNVVSQIRDGGIALVRNSMNNTIDHNDSKNNNGDGIFADSASTGNTFDHNELGGNTNLDAEDLSTGAGTGGTANTWTKNHGKTSNQSGLVS